MNVKYLRSNVKKCKNDRRTALIKIYFIIKEYYLQMKDKTYVKVQKFDILPYKNAFHG